jgi:hypothetical protein
MAWHLDPEWSFNPDPGKATEVEVTGGPGAEMREAVSSEAGWPEHLEHFRRAA